MLQVRLQMLRTRVRLLQACCCLFVQIAFKYHCIAVAKGSIWFDIVFAHDVIDIFWYIDSFFLLQTYNSEFHVAGSPANAENKGQVAAGVLSSLRYQIVFKYHCSCQRVYLIWQCIRAWCHRHFLIQIDFFHCKLTIQNFMLQVRLQMLRTRVRLLQVCCCLFVQIVFKYHALQVPWGSIWFDIGLARFHRFFQMHWSRLIDSGAADDAHAPEISGDAAGAPTSIIDA